MTNLGICIESFFKKRRVRATLNMSLHVNSKRDRLVYLQMLLTPVIPKHQLYLFKKDQYDGDKVYLT